MVSTTNLAYSTNIHLYRYMPDPVSGDRMTKEKGPVATIEEASLGDMCYVLYGRKVLCGSRA